MNWLEYICGCFNRQAIINYLSSSKLNYQVIEQQKCMQDYQSVSSIYEYSKANSFIYKQSAREQENVKNIQQASNQLSISQPQKKQIGSIYSRFVNPVQTLKFKFACLQYMLKEDFLEDPTFTKIFGSQDQVNLQVFWKNESTMFGKKVHHYRASFEVIGSKNKIDQFIKSTQNYQPLLKEKRILKEFQTVTNWNSQQSPEEQQTVSVQIVKRVYDKVLVVNQHQFITVQGTFKKDNQFFMCCSSIQDQSDAEFSRGWINLAGMKIDRKTITSPDDNPSLQNQQAKFQIILNVQLDVNLSPNSLKQPVCKQIRKYVQSIASSIKNPNIQ